VSNVKEMQYMFEHANFENNLLIWKPYNLENVENMFNQCSAPIPYWANSFNNSNVRGKAIDAYLLYNELNKELNNINSPIKKVKI